MGLSEEIWLSRHRMLTALLWVHAAVIAGFALLTGVGVTHTVADTAVLVLAASVARTTRLGRGWRTLAASLGLLTSSALLVHLAGGLIEMHFHFFVMIAVITLYQDWRPFLVAIGYVVVHHGVLGALVPKAVFDHAAAWNQPWRWAAVHGMFVLGASAAGMANWRLSEDARAAARKEHQFRGLLERSAVAANEAPDFDTAAQIVLDEVCTMTGWPLGHAHLRPEGAAALVSTAVWHVADPARFDAFRRATDEALFAPGRGLPGQVVVAGRPVWIDDISRELSSPRAAAVREAQLGSAFAFPVLIGEDVVGVLEFFADEAVRPDDALLDVTRHIGTQLGRLVERERAATRLGRSQELLAEAQRLAQLGSWEWDVSADRVSWSAELYRVFGLTADDFEPTYEGYLNHVHPDDREKVAATVGRSYLTHQQFTFDHRIAGEDGGAPRWVHCRGRVIVGPDGDLKKMVGSAQDVTERKQSERALSESEERFRTTQRHAPNGLALVGLDGRFLQVNPALCSLVGRPEEELLALGFRDITHPDDVEPGLVLQAQLLSGESQAYELEKRYVRPDGQVVWALLNGSLVRDPNGMPLYLISQTQDITERKRAEEALRQANARLQELASTDALTGVPNRSLFADHLDQDFARAQREGRPLALLFVDLDRFKDVNDSLGHSCGDELLVEVARRLSGAVRASDTVARLGGDEFAVLLASPTTPEEAVVVAERILESLGQSFATGGVEVHPSCSIGVACWPEDCGSNEELLQHADAAMYRAKAAGGNRFEMFQPAMTVAARDRLALEHELRRAVDREQLFLQYQPQVDLHTGRVVAVEALVRWAHPDRGQMPPAEFIPIAEETGLIVGVGAWVLDEGCRQLAEWRASLAGASDLRIAVNVSARQLSDPRFVGLVRDTLRAWAVPASRLELELTESMIIDEGGRAASAVRELRALGVSVAIDDFGTGYSSLSYLARFPVDRLKLDRSLIAGLQHHSEASATGETAIVAAAIGMARALGVDAVAEGIETEDQVAVLRALGLSQGQGYLWAPPLAPEDVVGWLDPVGVEARGREDDDRELTLRPFLEDENGVAALLEHVR